MLAGAEMERTRELKSYAGSGAWEGLKSRLGISTTEVAVDEGHQADKPLRGPSDDDNIEIATFGETIQVDPYADNSSNNEGYVDVEEYLVAS